MSLALVRLAWSKNWLAKLKSAEYGCCGYEGEGAPPYWPWVNSIRNYVQGTKPSLLQTQLGSGAGPVAEMIPEILGTLDGVEPTLNMEPDQARFRLFDAVTGFLKRASEHSPILLVLDDLHWADQPSLLLLEFIARQFDGSRILVTATYRAGYRSNSGKPTRRITGSFGPHCDIPAPGDSRSAI